MNTLIGYISLSENDNLHFGMPVFINQNGLETAIIDKASKKVSYFRPIRAQKYLPISREISLNVGDSYLYICLHKGCYDVGNYYEMAATLTMKTNLNMLESSEKYELFSLLELYHETKNAAQSYAEELNLPMINLDSFALPELVAVESEKAWEAIKHYGKLLSYCQNYLPLDEILKNHSQDTICLGKYLIEKKTVHQLYQYYGHLTKDYSHDLLVYIAHYSGFDNEFSNDKNYRIYCHFEISTSSTFSRQNNLVLAKNSQSKIFTLDRNAVFVSYQVDSFLFEMNQQENKSKTDLKNNPDFVIDISDAVFEDSYLSLTD